MASRLGLILASSISGLWMRFINELNFSIYLSRPGICNFFTIWTFLLFRGWGLYGSNFN